MKQKQFCLILFCIFNCYPILPYKQEVQALETFLQIQTLGYTIHDRDVLLLLLSAELDDIAFEIKQCNQERENINSSMRALTNQEIKCRKKIRSARSKEDSDCVNKLKAERDAKRREFNLLFEEKKKIKACLELLEKKRQVGERLIPHPECTEYACNNSTNSPRFIS